MPANNRQVATRVSNDVFEMLQIGLLVEGVETMQDLLRPVVEAYAEQLQEDKEIRALRDGARKVKDRKRGVSSLPAARRSAKSRRRRSAGAGP